MRQQAAGVAATVLLPEAPHLVLKANRLVQLLFGIGAKTETVVLFKESEIVALQEITPTGADKSYIGTTEIAGKGKIETSVAGSEIAGKADQYVSASTTSLRGKVGEEIAEAIAKEMDGFAVYNCKLNGSDNGFDVVAIKGTLDNPTAIRILESKPMNNGSVSLGITSSKGTQMSDQWIDGTIRQMKGASDLNLKALGKTLDDNGYLIEKYITTIDKNTKKIVILKLDKF